METNKIDKKFEINKDGKDLKLYFFTIQFGQVHINLAEEFQATFAYDKQSAINEVIKNYQDGVPIIIKERASVDVKKIVDVVDGIAPNIKVESSDPVPTKEKSISDFIFGMMLLSDEYIKNKKDKETIKKILNKIHGKNKQDIKSKKSAS